MMANASDVFDVMMKISVLGGAGAIAIFDKMGAVASKAGTKIEQMVSKATSGLKKFAGGMTVLQDIPGLGNVVKEFDTLGGAVAHLFASKLNIPESFTELLNKGWELNEAFDQVTDKLVGMTLALTDVGRNGNGIERAQNVAHALLNEFEGIALESGVMKTDVSAAFEKILPVGTALGKSYKDITEFTGNATRAATVFGVKSEDAVNKAVQGIMRPKMRSKDPFSIALAAEAGIKAGDTVAQKYAKINAALERMGQHIGAVNQGTEEATNRWKTLTDNVIQRVTKPLYDKIGDIIQGMVDSWLKQRTAVDDLIDSVINAANVAFKLADHIWSGTKFLLEFSGVALGVYTIVQTLLLPFKGIVQLIDAANSLFEAVSETVDYLANPGSGLDRMIMRMDELYIKLLKFADTFTGVADTVRGLFDFDYGDTENASTAHDVVSKQIAQLENELRIKQGIYLGAGQVGESPAERDERRGHRKYVPYDFGKTPGMSVDELKKMLAETHGNKRPLLEMNVNKIELKQDFRDQDPDRVMFEIVKGFEGLSEKAIQSAVGGAATRYGPGAST